jgi:hypothetical protein
VNSRKKRGEEEVRWWTSSSSDDSHPSPDSANPTDLCHLSLTSRGV